MTDYPIKLEDLFFFLNTLKLRLLEGKMIHSASVDRQSLFVKLEWCFFSLLAIQSDYHLH